MPDQDNSAPSGGGGLTDAQIASLVGTIITSAVGMVDTVARVEGNRVVGTSGSQYDLASVLAAQRAREDQRRRDEEAAREAEKTDWTPWIAAGAVGFVLFAMGMSR